MALPWTASRIGAVHLSKSEKIFEGKKERNHSSHPIDTITIESKWKEN